MARVDGEPVLEAELDAPLRIALHDLDQARYRIRRERLDALITARLGARITPGSAEWRERVEVALSPPPPPRFTLSVEGAPTRGHPDAPVTVAQFVDFESAHSRRLQPALVRLQGDYPDRVRLAAFDLPLPYHRHARQAALAAHCAGAQSRYWAYHDVLLLEQSELETEDLRTYAARLGLDTAAFDACLEAREQTTRVHTDLMRAAELGVTRAATVFVNGLYLSGRPDHAELERVVRMELERLGLDPTPTRSDASSRRTAPDAVPLGTTRPPGAEVLPEIPSELLAEPDIVITLARSDVDRALANRRRLEAQLEVSLAEFSGQRLLELREIVEGDLYSKLGLEAGDVLLIVNDAFLTAEYNALFETFAREPVVRLLVMRRGRPHTFEVRIGEPGD